ncbi:MULTISPECIES: hypothetical protein [Aeromonas]|uniref:Uncharacterized protein n=2 Tax=Aeromonas TaxID=642 RepID=A0AAX3P852_AERHY|nr:MULTISPECIES: hypothetical protein [Aeromonas]HDT5864790.1 hypothetical protein [Aeromonas hydrophila subsp. hydrophila]KHA54858.1 hypothetical protein NM74_20080 [Aeromonas hydrophila]MBR7631202.1 hypothetical protein [Aeromonas popoffii]MCV9384898.1 hypothetical protein [Aeromonas hydrophila]TNI63137.1 hypothetical protein CF121_05630 [Aeromonas media]
MDEFELKEHKDSLWLFENGQPVVDMDDMRVLDFGSYFSVEGGLYNAHLPAVPWRQRFIDAGIDFD